ncbi:UNVERIFIED_CONTAM: hypothetical protein K2H54_042383, partial [Gekko kuhli]
MWDAPLFATLLRVAVEVREPGPGGPRNALAVEIAAPAHTRDPGEGTSSGAGPSRATDPEGDTGSDASEEPQVAREWRRDREFLQAQWDDDDLATLRDRVARLRERLDYVRREARQNLSQAQRKQKQRYDRGTRERLLPVGPLTYEVRCGPGRRQKKHVHINDLKEWHPRRDLEPRPDDVQATAATLLSSDPDEL